MKYLVGVVVLTVALGAGAVSLADTVVLRDGSKITGKILEDADWGVKIETEYGAISIARRSISKVIKETEAHGKYKEKAKELAKGHVELARWCEEKGLEGEAKQHFELALKFDPDNEDARKALGFVKKDDRWVKGGEQAKKEPKKEPEKEPEEKPAEKPGEKLTRAELQKLHQEALQKLQDKEYEEAEKMYLKIVKAMPNDNIALYNLACLYSLTEKKEKAIDYLKKAVKAGFTNWQHIQKDTDLDNIREMEEYKKLIQELTKKDKRAMTGWLTDYNEALKKASESGRSIFVLFTASW